MHIPLADRQHILAALFNVTDTDLAAYDAANGAGTAAAALSRFAAV